MNSIKVYLQQFVASSVVMLELLRTACIENETQHVVNSKVRFLSTSEMFISQLKKIDDSFDYTKFVRKSFNVLKTPEHCKYLLDMDGALFTVRDADNKIVTILPGIDLNVGYVLFTTEQKQLFWQYMHLFACTVFNLIKSANETAFIVKYDHVLQTLRTIEKNIATTGIMFNNQIFNPFIGVQNDMEKTEYGVNDMFSGGELPKQQSVSLDTILSMVGIKNLINEEKLQEELKNFSEENSNEATERILDMLGAKDNTEIKDVCNVLIKDIVSNFKENGLENFSTTLMKVAENAKTNIDKNKMKKTAEQMQYFMENSKETLKNMKGADGEPIGEQLFKNMAGPLSMLNLFNKKQ